MTSQNTLSAIRAYLRSIADTRATGHATEHSYRPALEGLIEMLGGGGVKALNEPSHVECGAPDFIVEHNGVPIGHIECKDVGVNLDNAERSDQLKRYRGGLPNLILTDYLEFRWYSEGEFRESARLGRLNGQGGITFDRAGAQAVAALWDLFFTADIPSIDSPRDLAERMAAKARLLRDGINRILAKEGVTGPLHDLLNAYREVLISDLSTTDFADLQSQTAAYGLFAARCRHNAGSGPFTRQSAIFAETTPFLQDVFGRIAGPGIDQRIAWIVDDLALLLDRSDMGAVLADFGSRIASEDPVVHFYEDFLAAYDPRMRESRGVYYTPEPVVSYIVRSVDLLLRNQFDLADGLADTEKIKVEVPDGVDEEVPRVLILDPAAGTGTFLREVIASIRSTITKKGLAGAWPDYVKDHLLPRLFGFELLMAPYAICHLKLALEISGADGGFAMPAGERLNVFLTNTLEESHESSSGQRFLLAHEIAREAASADDVKRDKPVMVVLGNPPYSGHSANKGRWIRDLLHGEDGEEKTGNYFQADGEPLREQTPKWLNDDYVKFIRYAHRRIERTGEGVLGFVTNHSYLDNPTFRGMRQSLMDTFDEIYLLDLHGNSNKKERTPEGGEDENVFDIQQGVAVCLLVKRADCSKGPARVLHADLWGEREEGPHSGKYGWLSVNDVETTQWTELTPKSPRYLFIPRDEARAEEFEAGWGLKDAFLVNGVGITTAHDDFVISYDRERLIEQFHEFRRAERSSDGLHMKFGVRRKAGWNILDGWDNLQDSSELNDYVESICYRPFDKRFIFYEDKIVWRTAKRVMRHMLAGPNLGVVTTRQCQQNWSVMMANTIIGHKALAAYDVNSLFPLYTYPTEEQEQVGQVRESNLSKGFVEALGSSLALEFVPDGPGDLRQSFGPEDVLHYIYAVLHSPEYRRRYADFLKSDFARVPLTGDRSLFAVLVDLGKRLSSLHLMESEGGVEPSFPTTGDNRVDKERYRPPVNGSQGRVYINRDQYFDGVTPDTWEFTIGGYRPAEKWLKDRRRRTLSYEDITHYRRICAILDETPKVMAQIDESIVAHGGWPLG